MDFDFTPYFEKYEKLVTASDEAFNRVKNAHADCVTCAAGCADCCHALFDLTLIEALYINHRYQPEISRGLKKPTSRKAPTGPTAR